MTDFNNFQGAAKRIDDLDLPRIGNLIGVGEDELHAFMDVETVGSGFDAKGRPKILFEPHVFYRNLSGAARTKAVTAGLAYAKWGAKPYPKDSYPRLLKALEIDETAALKACSWGLVQTLGENFKECGYKTVQALVLDFMEDEDNHLEAAVKFIRATGIDDELRALARLTRPTTPEDCVTIVKVYNGPGYAKNKYHIKFAAAHNKWRKIKDTPYHPETNQDLIRQVQEQLIKKGYPEVGTADGTMGERTRDTITIFQRRNGIPMTGEVTNELLVALMKAPQRQNSEARENATVSDIKEDKSVSLGSTLKKIGSALLGIAGLGGVTQGSVNLDEVNNSLTSMKSLYSTIQVFLPWIAAGVIGYVILHYGRKIVCEQLELYREGKLFIGTKKGRG